MNWIFQSERNSIYPMLASMYGGCHSLDVSSVHQEKYVIIDFNAIQMKLPKRLYIQKTTEKKVN